MKQNLDFATQIAALCGNKQAVADLRLSMIYQAVLTAVKGTNKYWIDGAATASKSKGATAKALTAGFTAVGLIPLLIKPQEPITAEERAARNEAEAERITGLFETAYLAALPVPPTDDEKKKKAEEKKAAQDAAVAAAVEKEIEERGLVTADKVMTDADVLRAALALLVTGRATPAMLDDFRDALGVPAALAQEFAKGKAAALAEFADSQVGAIAAAAAAGAPAAPAAAVPAPGKRASSKKAGKEASVTGM